MSNPAFKLLQGDPATWGTPPLGYTYVGVNLSGVLVLKQDDGTITPVVSSSPAITDYANTVGSTTITPASSVQTAVVTLTNGARVASLVLDEVGLQDGQLLAVKLALPDVNGLVIYFYSGDTLGSPLSSFTTASGSGISNGLWNFYAQDGAWKLLSNQIPASS